VPSLDVRRTAFGDPVVQALVAQLQAELVVRYGGPDRTPLDPAMFDAPSGAFFVGWTGDQPEAMGGWRRRTDVSALGGTVVTEVKRMYVVPAARGRGLSRLLLTHLEDSAAAGGADVMVLETGMEQPEAIGLYESSGYVPIPGFGLYKDSPENRCFGKRLAGEARLPASRAG
jgi:GNAT superfamily N-acetyltransferase